MRRVQYVDTTTSPAEEDNWDYDRIQRVENTKQKKGFYNATLLVNNVPINFIIDSGSPVPLIPECLFCKLTPIEPLKTTYKDVNNQKIDFTGQTKAMVKTNKEPKELPLLITKAQTAPLMGLDWMQRLKSKLSSNSDAIQIHNINVGSTEKKKRKLLNDFKDLFYNNKEIKKSLCQNKFKSWSKDNTTKRTTNPNTSTRPSGQIDKNRTRFQKIKRNYCEAKSTIAEYGSIDITDFKKEI